MRPDPRWELAAEAMRRFERSTLARTGLLAASVEQGIRVEACVRAAAAVLDADAVAPSLPNWHEGGQGAPILFLNGWSASGLCWPAGVVEPLERTNRVVRVDNRGTGWSRRMRRPFTIADLAADARRVLDAIAVDRAVVVGLSMGGMVAQELALRHPSRVAHLVLIGTRPPMPEYTSPRADVTARLMSAPAPGQSLRQFMRERWAAVTGPGFADAHPEAIREIARSIVERPTPRAAVLDQARAIAAWHGAHRLRGLDVPATVVHGERDPLIPVRNGMRLAQLIPGARYVELAGVGHLVPYEDPAATLAVIADATR